MKNKITALIISGALAVSAMFSLASCDASESWGGGEMEAREVYAISLVSSIGYLSGNRSEDSSVSMASYYAPAPAKARPDIITDSDVKKIEECLSLFSGIVADGGVTEEVRENTSENPMFSEYNLEMTISLHNASGEAAPYIFYFNEISKSTETEIEAGVEEIEESTYFEGVALFGEEIFVVKGVREVETEGNETETSIEFRTYKNLGGSVPAADERNYVEIEKSSEQGEYEYEYTFVENGRTVEEIEIEYQQTASGVQISFETESGSNGNSFEIKKGSDEFIRIEFEKSGAEGKITVIPQQDGSYTLAYSNGYQEIVNKN